MNAAFNVGAKVLYVTESESIPATVEKTLGSSGLPGHYFLRLDDGSNIYVWAAPKEVMNYGPTAAENKACSHDWKEYVGFTQKYDYCTKCDEKRV